ncbi:MAG: hypothetical protein R2713_10600 [Ilumatobacteraceae bacterium]
MSDHGDPGLRHEISEASSTTSSWSGPNERTAFVDAALVRVVRALDAVASHHADGDQVELVVDTAAQSTLEFEVGNDGLVVRRGVVGGRVRAQRSRLLRPVIRGVARASRPRFREARHVGAGQ